MSSTSMRDSPGASAEGPERELGADDRGQLDDPSLALGETLDPRGEQRLDRWWHVDRLGIHGQHPPGFDRRDHTVVDEHPHELAHEQGVAVGRGGKAFDQLGWQVTGTQELSGEPGGRLGVEPVERDHQAHPAPDFGERRPDLA